MISEKSEGQGCLINKVIARGLCVRCGACVGLCPYFNYYNGEVVVIDQCHSDNSRCLQLCPLAEHEATTPLYQAKVKEASDIAIGPLREIFLARARDRELRAKSQYGGAVSALLIYALENGLIKGAVMTDKGDDLAPKGMLARDRDQVIACSGSRYSGSAALSELNLCLKTGMDQLGVVGLPCQMEALARMRRMLPDGAAISQKIALKIGLFCTWAIDYRGFSTLLKTRGIDTKAEGYDILPPPADVFRVKNKTGYDDFSLSDIRPLIQKGCSLCQDMTAQWADISIGTAEEKPGWNTIIVRTSVGAEIIRKALEDNFLERDHFSKKGLEHLNAAAANKRLKGIKARRDLDRSHQ